MMNHSVDHIKEIDKIIQKAAIEGVLTKGAVTQFHGLLTENEKLTEELSVSVAARDALRKERDEARQHRDVVMQECETWAGREQDLLTRESECLKLELDAKWNAQRVDDHKNMMALIFKPSALRKDTWRTIPGFDQQGYASGSTGNENENSTEHDE